MHIRPPRDFWSGLIFLAIAFGFIALSAKYNIGNMHRMGPALFPILVGTLLAGLGAIIAGRALVIDGPPLPEFTLRPLLITIVAMTLFGLALQWLGLVAAIALVVLVGAFASREARLSSTVALAAGLIFFSIAIFIWVLGLPIRVWPYE